MGNNRKASFLQKHKEQAVKVGANDMYPKFSFEFCFGSKRAIDKTTKETKHAVIEKLINLSQLTWKQIRELPRKQGFERLKKPSFNSLPNVPVKFRDENNIDVFRLPSEIGRLIGYIEEDTFFIVWIDTDFNMYSH